MNSNKSVFLVLIGFVLVLVPQSGARAGEPPPKDQKSAEPDVTEVQIQTLNKGQEIQKVPVVVNASSIQRVGRPVEGLADKDKGDGGKSAKKDLDDASHDDEKSSSKKKALDDEDDPVANPDPGKAKAAADSNGAVKSPNQPVFPATTSGAPVDLTTKFAAGTAKATRPAGVIAKNRQNTDKSDGRHADDLNSLKGAEKESRTMANGPLGVTTEKVSVLSKGNPEKVETSGTTSLVIGVIFGVILLSVLLFVGFKRLDAIRRRREYRKMNDFLIDGMYNDL